MDEKKSGLLTRRQALLSIATITAGAAVLPRAVFGATPAKDKIKFIAIGDFGTGDNNQSAIAAQMLRDHKTSPLDFVLAVGDNIYPDGGGRHFEKKFARPYAGLIREGVKFHAVLGNHDVRDGRGDQCQYPLFNMNGQCHYTIKKGDGLAEFFDRLRHDPGRLVRRRVEGIHGQMEDRGLPSPHLLLGGRARL